MKKLMASIPVFCGILNTEGESRTESLKYLLSCLGHGYPSVRIFSITL